MTEAVGTENKQNPVLAGSTVKLLQPRLWRSGWNTNIANLPEVDKQDVVDAPRLYPSTVPDGGLCANTSSSGYCGLSQISCRGSARKAYEGAEIFVRRSTLPLKIA